MIARKSLLWINVLSVIAVLLFAVTASAESEQPSNNYYRVDATYNKDATSGLAMRYPGPATITDEEAESIRYNGNICKSPVLDVAFSMLEEGNPFLERYNILTSSNIQPLLGSGIPYFFGGRDIKKIIIQAPAYKTWISWQDSKVYYKKDRRYFLGFDCKGFTDYLHKTAWSKEYKLQQNIKKNPNDRIVIDKDSFGNKYTDMKESLEIGDVVAVYHPSLHTTTYIGTLADYGYTADEFPDDPSILDYPLVTHCGLNAAYADWFYRIKEENQIYHRTSVPDGGVSISILGYSNKNMINTIRQQKQDTSWVQLPDNSWLTVIGLEDANYWAAFR